MSGVASKMPFKRQRFKGPKPLLLCVCFLRIPSYLFAPVLEPRNWQELAIGCRKTPVLPATQPIFTVKRFSNQ
jgi:hypothetical protein